MKNEQAFPSTEDKMHRNQYSNLNYHQGLTKREYIAIQAMQALIAKGSGYDLIAKQAVTYADHLLAELQK